MRLSDLMTGRRQDHLRLSDKRSCMHLWDERVLLLFLSSDPLQFFRTMSENLLGTACQASALQYYFTLCRSIQ
eukprot:gene4239-3063_t